MRRLVAVLAVTAALAGCGLPLPSGVRAPGLVPDEQPRTGQVAVLPPGPAEDASPVEVVEGFLGAQSSPEGGYAVARQYLSQDKAQTWRVDQRVEVYDPARPPEVTQTSAETVRVVSQRLAVLEPDGAYQRAGGEVVDDYRVRCVDGQCRIAALKDGLRLTPRALVRSFAPRGVHFLAPSSGEATAEAHLAVDLVWLPRSDLAGRLVQAVLDGPSGALGASVRTAVPVGTELSAPVRTGSDGTVTVDLTAPAGALDERGREQLSAQLVWTLRALGTGFTRLRLQVEGRGLEVDGSRAPQPATAWPAYDPERLRPRAPALYVEGRQLRSLLDGGLASSAATEGQLPVDVAAASPDGFLALLTRTGPDDAELRTGPQAGPFGDPRAQGRLSSPSWGSGEQGVFLLRAGSVVLLPAEGPLREVEVEGLALPVRRLQVARDGVRVALLAGEVGQQRLFVGRLLQEPGGPRVVGLREIVPTLTRTVDVAWESGTSLLVLARQAGGDVLPVRLAVDGSAGPVLDSRLPQGVTPVSLTAAADRPVVLSGRRVDDPDGPERLYREEAARFVQQGPGSRPFYPG